VDPYTTRDARSGRSIRGAIAGTVLAGLCLAAPALAQGPRQPARPGAARGATPAELQRMFDAYALIQAQDQLGIDDDHYAPFLTRFKALQDLRQRAQAERGRRLVELRRLANADSVDEPQVTERLAQLDALDERTADAVRDAYAKIDEVLSVRQRARFRIFEEQMERQKIDLLMRARQANRRQQPPP
jgi:hypothetical protein